MIRGFSFVFALLFAGSLYAQNQPCDTLANTGEVNCLYQVVGQDSCPTDESTPCPSGGCDFVSENGDSFWACILNNTEVRQWGYVNLSPGATVPKWSAPPNGISGKASTIVSALACGRHYVCLCSKDPMTAERYCKTTECGLKIIWNLGAKNISCDIAQSE